MSKTYRRKHLKSNHCGVVKINGLLYQHGYFGGMYLVDTQHRKLSVEHFNKIMEAKYHSDTEQWGQVPSHFTRMLNKLYRSRMNQRIKIAILNDELESLSLDKRLNNARWWWT